MKEVTSKAIVDFEVSDTSSTTKISDTDSFSKKSKKKTVSFSSEGNNSSNESASTQIVNDKCQNSGTDNV